MHISISDYDMMARDVIDLIASGLRRSPAVSRIARENNLTHKECLIMTQFVCQKTSVTGKAV